MPIRHTLKGIKSNYNAWIITLKLIKSGKLELEGASVISLLKLEDLHRQANSDELERTTRKAEPVLNNIKAKIVDPIGLESSAVRCILPAGQDGLVPCLLKV